MSVSLKVVLAGNATTEFAKQHLANCLTTEWTMHPWIPADGEQRLQAALRDADAIVSEQFGKIVLDAPKLRLFQIPFAGYDWLRRDQIPADCTVCNTYEHEIPIAEYVLLCMLEWQFRLFDVDRDFRSGSWRYCMPPKGPFHGEIYDKTVGLIGYGHIAKAIAKRAAAFGTRVIAVAPTQRDRPPPLDWIGTTADDLDRLLAESDYLVITCPLNEQTRGMIGAAEFAKMKPGAVLINVARGKIVDEQALYDALRNEDIAGAFIDTWYRYPFEPGRDRRVRPSAFAFHELDNLYMTPHCSGWTRQLVARRWAFVASNLDRFARGEALQNVIAL